MSSATPQLWEIIHFPSDNSVSAVPDFWFNKVKKTCAWPRHQKNVAKFIANRQKLNKNDFVIYRSCRKLGLKAYETLAEAKAKCNIARKKSDIDTTEDDEINESKLRTKNIHISNQAAIQKVRKNLTNSLSQPIKYSDFLSKNTVVNTMSTPTKSSVDWHSLGMVTDEEDNDDIQDDTDKDPNWDQQKISEVYDSIEIVPDTPLKSAEVENDLFSPNIKKAESEDCGQLLSYIINDDKGETLKVVEENNYKTQPKQNIPPVLHSTYLPKLNNGHTTLKTNESDDGSFMSNHDFQKFVFTTLTHLKYDINAMSNIVNITSEHVNVLMSNSNQLATNNSHMLLANVELVDMDLLFPISNDDKLNTIESRIIEDQNFRKTLVTKLSLLVSSDLGTSVRRIMARTFDDQFLMEYSLVGLKKKRPFSKLLIHRVIIDSIRMHIKYKLTTEKEIEVPLSVWMSHAKFRRDKEDQKTKKMKL